MINTTLLSKATKIRIILTHKSKNNVQHYAVIFHNIPYMDKNHRTYYSEVIFHDCTFTRHNINPSFTYSKKYNIKSAIKKEIIIGNAQSFLYDYQFAFEYHEEPSTTKLITIQYQEYPEED